MQKYLEEPSKRLVKIANIDKIPSDILEDPSPNPALLYVPWISNDPEPSSPGPCDQPQEDMAGYRMTHSAVHLSPALL
jgi:hypothetical protein